MYKKENVNNVLLGAQPPNIVNVAQPSLPVVDPDIMVDKEMKKLFSVLEFQGSEFDALIDKVNAVVLSTPDPTKDTAKNVKEMLI